ncbi:MAG: FAD-binding oxidoreductase [Cyanobacteria bacterium NC_groundwater_1444_Ag_S-0.65um_54_12]|nr:FAD-binding oxidoreductase [Cyanobacteria bacterium NC_groundwater_1444_Ag_S-0.65um_54_12]
MMLPMPTRWWGWGDTAHSFSLAEHSRLWPFISSRIGELATANLPVDINAIELPPPRLGAAELSELAVLAGGESCLATDKESRVRHAYGKSYQDLIRLRRGQLDSPPDAIVFPRSHEAVMGILALAVHRQLPIVPFGGGTSVVGGITGPDQPYLVLSLAALNRLISVDSISRTARAQAGISGPELERSLAGYGMTLGHFPQSFEYSTLGGWIATRSAGQQSSQYGKIEDMVLALRLATPRGELATLALPAASDGPELKRFLAGSEGTLGVITEAVLRTWPIPATRDYQGILMPSFEAGITCIRQLLQKGLKPATLRLANTAETLATFAMRPTEPSGVRQWVNQLAKRWLGPLNDRCLLISGFEGTIAEVKRQKHYALKLAKEGYGGVSLGAKVGQEWYRQRFALPYLRDVLLDHGIMVDTLETATMWSNLSLLYQEVNKALETALANWGTPGLVLCHVSHAYLNGASLYFTFIARQDPDHVLEQWWACKSAALHAIVANGGALSHHHGVGRDHAPWLTKAIGPLGVQLIQSARHAIDPAGLLNPQVFAGTDKLQS